MSRSIVNDHFGQQNNKKMFVQKSFEVFINANYYQKLFKNVSIINTLFTPDS